MNPVFLFMILLRIFVLPVYHPVNFKEYNNLLHLQTVKGAIMKLIVSILMLFMLMIPMACSTQSHYSSKSSMKKKHDYYNMHELDQKRRDKTLIREMKKN